MIRELVRVGRVGRPHGLDGAFVVEQASDDERRFAVGAELVVGGEPALVLVSRRVGKGRRAIRLDRPVERGQDLAVPRSVLPEPGPGSYYVFQLVGLSVEVDGTMRGTVADVLPGVANDNLVLDDGTLVPLIGDAIATVELEAGRVVVNPAFI
jgi:16S rRNA processing protein RimM